LSVGFLVFILNKFNQMQVCIATICFFYSAATIQKRRQEVVQFAASGDKNAANDVPTGGFTVRSAIWEN